jgi:PKD repeat protein
MAGTRAQSEVIGVAFLTGVIVLLVGLVALNTFAVFETTSGPTANLDADVGPAAVTLEHQGGDSLEGGETEVVFSDGSTVRHWLDSFTIEQGDAGRFEPGESWSHAHNKSGTIRIIVVHRGETDTVVLDTEADVPSNEGPDPAFTYTPTSPTTQDTVTFDATSADDPDGSITSYQWNFDEGTTATGQTVSHTFDDDGSYDVTVTTTDDDGATGSRTQAVQVRNVGPTAAVSFAPTSPDTSDTIAFDGSGSSDPDGSITSYAWDFGDGTTATGSDPSHSYGDDGSYAVTLTVTDDDGVTDIATTTLTVANRGPTASLTTSPSDPDTTDDVTFDAGGSSDPDGSITSYQWDFGDGTTGTGQSTTHSFADNGSYTVSLTVTDDDGATDSTATTVQVDNVAPTVDFETRLEDVDGDGANEIVYDASASTDPDGSITRYRWDIDEDGTVEIDTTSPTAAVESIWIPDQGDVTLTLTDDDGATKSRTQSNEWQPTPGFEVFGVLLAVLLGGELRRRNYL